MARPRASHVPDRLVSPEQFLAPLPDLRATPGDSPSGEAHQSIGRLYQDHAPRLSALGHRFIGDEALDVVHEVFLDLPRLLAQYRGDGLSAWLRRIVVTRCLMRLRRRHRFLEGDIAKDIACSRDHPASFERDQWIRAALARLPIQLREIVVLKFFLSMTHQEIGECLEITSTASELKLFRAVKQLRQAFQA